MKKSKKIPGKNPFKVPEGYFEEVNKRIISAATAKSRDNKTISSSFRLRPYLLAAASIAGFIILSYSAFRIISPKIHNSYQTALLPDDSISSYMYELDINSLEDKAASLSITEPGPDLNKSDIIDYLVLENIEINEIYEQL